MRIIRIDEMPEIKDQAVKWFSEKWGNHEEEYLTSIKHERIEYEKEEHDDTAAQPVDKPETAGTKEK